MSDLSSLPLPVKLLLAALALVAVVGLLAALFRTAARLPYQKREFLSPAELLFFRALEQAIDGEFYLFPKVRIGDLLNVVEGTKDARNYFARIGQKHIDFMLADRDDVKPVLVIELDDGSHDRPDRRERDQFVDSALAAAGLAILRIPCARDYSLDSLRAILREHLPVTR